ncbi:uncharacterized protein EI97DRAFT_306240 [Westerdykella ornata]|uniref:Amidohydrolase-related domain-containing protein n=1 Tax=Westerdykella ornata TaxID=318751 RepID=A0A6A6JK97_WESOR|nr:uncharacterized protein EI97DRAFT_306240 [Westerdykella ornata]KAF2277021.1 hypothetical protein EI97DRAFT_306240 [Westerdykella ornata]
MAPHKLLDTHIHLWPSTSTSPSNHAWMTPGHILAKRHGISDYKAAVSASPVQPTAFIYVETDRYLPTPSPPVDLAQLRDLSNDEQKNARARELLEHWAHEPLEELRFLRRIVEGTPEDAETDGFDAGDGDCMVGCVIWAPFHLAPQLFDMYLDIAERVAGPRLWGRVVGFRYLLQGIEEEDILRKLLQSEEWKTNILRLRSGRGGQGWTFDVGVDAHRGAVGQVEAAADMVEMVREREEKEGGKGRVKFVLNHLCKPDLSSGAGTGLAASEGWLRAVRRLAAVPGVYMKLSGALNEFAPDPTPEDVDGIAARMDFYGRNVFDLFWAPRVMFGSDWPVCNLGGPRGEQGNWALWREVVGSLMERCGITDVEDVWWKTGCEAYGVDIQL